MVGVEKGNYLRREVGFPVTSESSYEYLPLPSSGARQISAGEGPGSPAGQAPATASTGPTPWQGAQGGSPGAWGGHPCGVLLGPFQNRVSVPQHPCGKSDLPGSPSG